MLSASGISKSFGALLVLSDVDFAVREGEAVGIVGPNGAGKTTLLNILSGAYAPSAGRVALRGEDVSTLDAAARCRRGIARSHQIPRPFSGMTVFENLLVGARAGGGMAGRQAERACLDALDQCAMLPLANRRGETLGLLDRKRLELARALATRPQVLLLDEIGGGLTDGEAADLVGIIQAIRARGIAIVWIEHIVHILVQVVGRLVCMDAGRVIAAGDPREVLRDAAVIDAYLGPSATHAVAVG
jgi:branched-chain amino acid transport system ATP-binding protein